MTSLSMTRHAAVRAAQRGIRDIDLIEQIGTEVDDGFLVTEKSYQEFEREMKAEIKRARRLVGKRIVVVNGKLVTAYHARGKDLRRLLRSCCQPDC